MVSTGEKSRLSTEMQDVLALSGSKAVYLGPIIDLALGTAMRQSELLQLKLENVCLDRRLIRITGTKNDVNRAILMMANVCNIFNVIKSNNKLVFKVKNLPLRQSWIRLIKRVGIENLHFHNLRHKAIFRFFEMGFTPPEVASISRQRTLSLLMRYNHANTSLVADKLKSM